MMRKAIFLLILLFASPLWASVPAGKVADLSGEVWVTRAGGKPAPANINQEIFSGDILETKSNGAVKILFLDDTLLIVKENSRVLISEFLFDAKGKKRTVVFNTPFGTIRTVVGRSFGKNQPVEIQTPVAVSGIRGTDIGAQIKPKTTTFYCFFCKKETVQITNLRFPKQAVFLTTDQSIQLLEGRPALKEDILLIPKDILEKRETIFNFQTGKVDQKEEAPDLVEQKQKEEEMFRSIPGTIDSDTPINPGGAPESEPSPSGGGGEGGGKM